MTTIQMGGDEGMECIKELLCTHGMAEDCWNDQPWFSTQLLSLAFWVCHGDITLVRSGVFALVIVIFMCASRLMCGRCSVWVMSSMLLLWFTTPDIFDLNFAIMLEIPAFAFAMLSAATVSVGLPGRNTKWLVVAGLLFALACQIKFTAAILLPAIICEFLFTQVKALAQNEMHPNLLIGRASGWFCFQTLITHRRTLMCVAKSALVFVGTAVATTAILVVSAPYWDWNLLWREHIDAKKFMSPADIKNTSFNLAIFANHYYAVLAAAVGSFILAKRKQWKPLGFCGCFVFVAFILEYKHNPWWWYYYIHFAIPLSMLGGYAILELIRVAMGHFLQVKPQTYLVRFAAGIVGSGLLVFILWTGGNIFIVQLDDIKNRPHVEDSKLIMLLRELRPVTPYMYTKYTMIAFHAGIPIVPFVAVQPKVRYWTGDLSDEKLKKSIQLAKPPLILLSIGSPKTPSWWGDWISKRYKIIYADQETELWASKEIAQNREGILTQLQKQKP